MSSLRVLVAGDSDLLNSVLKTSLLLWGYEVFTVQDGEQACLALCLGNLDLCIISSELGKVSGLEVCRFVRQSDISRQPYVILLTPSVSAESMRAAYMAGANDFLTPPLSLQDVRTRIAGVAGRITQVHSQAQAFQGLDPIERYRRDLALLT